MAKCKICECEFKRKSTLSNEKVYSLTLDDNERCEECCYKIFLFLQSCGELLI